MTEVQEESHMEPATWLEPGMHPAAHPTITFPSNGAQEQTGLRQEVATEIVRRENEGPSSSPLSGVNLSSELIISPGLRCPGLNTVVKVSR